MGDRKIDVALAVTDKGNQLEDLDATLSIEKVPDGCGAIFSADDVNDLFDTVYLPGETIRDVVQITLICQNPGLTTLGDNFVLTMSVPLPDDTNPTDNVDSLTFAALTSR